MTHDVDLLIAGGGPAGLATAIEARMRGLSVLVIEPRAGAIDKACGEGLMPGAIPELARIGVDPQGFPLLGVSYRSAGRRADHRFPAPGRGVRRTTLHRALGDRAAALEVGFEAGKVDDLAQDGDGVTVSGIRARYLVAADGLHSAVRRLIGAELPVRARRRFGLRQHFSMEPESEFIEVHWTPSVEAYVTPVGGGVVGIAVLGPRGTDFAASLAGIPELAARVKGRASASPLRGAGPFRQRTARRVSGRVLLVGDASGYVDAITGEGIRLGLAQARVAVDAIVADRPLDYERAWRRSTHDFRMLTSALVGAAGTPLRAGIVPLATRAPWLFGAAIDRLAR